jgi:hypothetical protein
MYLFKEIPGTGTGEPSHTQHVKQQRVNEAATFKNSPLPANKKNIKKAENWEHKLESNP